MDKTIAPLSVRLSNCATWHDQQADKASRERNWKDFERHTLISDELHMAVYRIQRRG